ncbi:Shedu immune nuclease family protein [Nocardia tengchongensis]|uniref:Shedu immune nuclease family protein n=1 Tax=Nocardia tengchongensis TaxID=2055889 RepID=UPI0036C3DB87
MARVLRLAPGQQRIEAHDVNKGVDCHHTTVTSAEGETLLHLTTFGSKDRESPPKSSQSLQLDAGIAAELVTIIRETFGDDALHLQPQLDIAFPAGSPTADLQSLAQIYRRSPDVFRALISSDKAAGDVIAMAHRRSQVEYFEQLLHAKGFVASEADRLSISGEEGVWQHFFEQNPWIFGVSLSGQLLTSWSEKKLEQVVSGHSLSGPGKRVDALLRTSGRISSLVFAEIKTPNTELLMKKPYRSGCWAPSHELAGAVAQVQGTVHLAVKEIGEKLDKKDEDGSNIPGEVAYLLRPRSYLIVGNLASLRGKGDGVHEDRFRSFELFRRNLSEPEVVTFDELLERAKWIVTNDAATHPEDIATSAQEP